MMQKKPSVCLFCKESGPFNTIEHIVPESLGNDSDILVGLVCDKCQNYLGSKVEKPALEKTPFAFWRTFLGIKTKKDKLPSFTFSPPSKGKIPAQHPLTDEIGFTAHHDGSTSVEIYNSSLVHQILTGKKHSFVLVASPWHLSIMGRFIGKIGLEYLASSNYDLAMTSQFDALRIFVRHGSTKYLWPLYMSQHGTIDDIKGTFVDKGEFLEQEVFCYEYFLGVINQNEYVFVLSVGTDVILICLSHRKPDNKFKKLIQGVVLKCVHYPDNSW